MQRLSKSAYSSLHKAALLEAALPAHWAGTVAAWKGARPSIDYEELQGLIRRQKKENSGSGTVPGQPPTSAPGAAFPLHPRAPNVNLTGGSRQSTQKMQCYYCYLFGHFIKDYKLRKEHEKAGFKLNPAESKEKFTKPWQEKKRVERERPRTDYERERRRSRSPERSRSRSPERRRNRSPPRWYDRQPQRYQSGSSPRERDRSQQREPRDARERDNSGYGGRDDRRGATVPQGFFGQSRGYSRDSRPEQLRSPSNPFGPAFNSFGSAFFVQQRQQPPPARVQDHHSGAHHGRHWSPSDYDAAEYNRPLEPSPPW